MDPAPPWLLCRLLTRHPRLDPAPARPVAFREAGEDAVNDAAVSFPAMPACTVLGVELLDPEGRACWAILLLEAQPVPARAEVLIPVGALVLTGSGAP